MTLLFDPNDRKDRINRKKHGLSFDEAKEIFSRPGEVLTIPDQRKDTVKTALSTSALSVMTCLW